MKKLFAAAAVVSTLSGCANDTPLKVDNVRVGTTITSGNGNVRVRVNTSASTQPTGLSGYYKPAASGLTASQKRQICSGQTHIQQIECVNNLG